MQVKIVGKQLNADTFEPELAVGLSLPLRILKDGDMDDSLCLEFGREFFRQLTIDYDDMRAKRLA